MKLKNIEAGIRGVYTGSDEKPIMLIVEPGQTVDDIEMSSGQLEIAKGTGWFEITGAGSRGPRGSDDK